MDAKEVALRDSPDVTWAWCCAACNSIWFEAAAANTCCCVQSSVQTEAFSTKEELFVASTKVWYSDYEGAFLYWDAADMNGKFFRNRTDIEKYCTEKQLVPPQWVWACEPAGFLLDAEQVLAVARDANSDSVRDLVDDTEVEKLQAVLDAWVMAQNLESHNVNYTTVVVLDRALMRGLERAS